MLQVMAENHFGPHGLKNEGGWGWGVMGGMATWCPRGSKRRSETKKVDFLLQNIIAFLKKATVSPARDERNIDFDSLTAANQSERVPRTEPQTFHRHSLARPSEPLSVNTVWGMSPD